MPPWHLGYLIWRPIPGRRRARWVYHPFDLCLLLVDKYSTRYLFFHQGDTCTIEPYHSSWFARQFRYDKLSVVNPNTGLHFNGNLFEGELHGIFMWPVGREWCFVFLEDLPMHLPASVFAIGILLPIWYRFKRWMLHALKPSSSPIVLIGDPRPFVRREWMSTKRLRKRLTHVKRQSTLLEL